ncbi:MAG: hypothetical protein MUF72_21810 [Elainella sp. Prado103]|jgi:hypothetical protein|nr:hypothetical protein [Elainella sp. Prado103]
MPRIPWCILLTLQLNLGVSQKLPFTRLGDPTGSGEVTYFSDYSPDRAIPTQIFLALPSFSADWIDAPQN